MSNNQHKLIAIKRNLAEAHKLTKELMEDVLTDDHNMNDMALDHLELSIGDALGTTDEIEV